LPEQDIILGELTAMLINCKRDAVQIYVSDRCDDLRAYYYKIRVRVLCVEKTHYAMC